MSNRTSRIILYGTLLAVILGFFGGYYFGEIFLTIRFLGIIFLNGLRVLAVPFVVVSMILGVASLGDIRKMGRTAGKTFIYFFATTAIAVMIGLILVNILRPGLGVPRFDGTLPDFIAQSENWGIIDVISAIIPGTIIQAVLAGQFLALVIFSFVFGWALTTFTAGRIVVDLLEAINKAIMKVVTLIIYLAPFGVLALIGGIVAENREAMESIFSHLGLLSATIIIGLLIQGVVVLPLLLKFLGKQNPLPYLSNMGEALFTALATGSSPATYPLAYDGVVEKSKIDRRAGHFVLPFGTAINSGGTALYQAVAAVFVAQVYGLDLSIIQQLMIFIVSILASIGMAGIPYAGMVTMTFIFSAVGLPLEGIGLILLVDWLLGRCAVTIDVWGNSIGAAVIAETTEIKGYQKAITRIRPEEIRIHKPDVKPSRPEKPFKGARYDSYENRDSRGHGPRRQEYQKRERRPDERKGRGDRGPRPEPRERIRKEPGPVPRATIEKDLENIRKQLAPADISEPSAKTQESAVPEPPVEEKKKDEIFDIEIPRFNFFEEKKKSEETGEETSTEEPSSGEKAPTAESPEPTEERPAPAKELSEPESLAEGPEDSWGRGKKKHLSK